MSGDTNETDADADRLEAALERIARYAAVHPVRSAAVDDSDQASPESDEIAARLDALIDRLRTALAGRPH